MSWLPLVGAAIIMLIGVICFFRPQMLMDACGIKMTSNMAISEVRGVFGGMNIGGALAAFMYGSPEVYLVLAMAWTGVAAARFYSIAVDGSTIKESIPPIVLDGAVALMFFAGACQSTAAL